MTCLFHIWWDPLQRPKISSCRKLSHLLSHSLSFTSVKIVILFLSLQSKSPKRRSKNPCEVVSSCKTISITVWFESCLDSIILVINHCFCNLIMAKHAVNLDSGDIYFFILWIVISTNLQRICKSECIMYPYFFLQHNWMNKNITNKITFIWEFLLTNMHVSTIFRPICI